MENEAILDYMILNGKIISTSQLNPTDIMKGKSIYEVIRLKNGAALYMEEHIERMRESAKLIGNDIGMSDLEIKSQIKRLADCNGEYGMNVKLVATNFSGGGSDFAAYFIMSFYPPLQMYETGIHTILYCSERENPHAKTVNRQQRQQINRAREKEGAFEALLVNAHGQVTEGSRSNLFFVKGAHVYTPPAGDVLLGITRKKVVDICIQNGIDVVERNIDSMSLGDYDAAFITGTSINVLPVKSIGSLVLDSSSNRIVTILIDSMKKDIDRYIRSNKL